MKLPKTAATEINSNVTSGKRSSAGYLMVMWVASVLIAFNAHVGDRARSETVKFADLNLGTPAGVEALYRRIHGAARRVCMPHAGERAAVRACVTKAESEAIRKVDVPLLTALYQNKSGNHPQTMTASQ